MSYKNIIICSTLITSLILGGGYFAYNTKMQSDIKQSKEVTQLINNGHSNISIGFWNYTALEKNTVKALENNYSLTFDSNRKHFRLTKIQPSSEGSNQNCHFTRIINDRENTVKTIRDMAVAGYVVSLKEGKTLLVQKDKC